MKSINAIATQVIASLDRILNLVQGDINTNTKDYKTWQKNFLRRRLNLAIFIMFFLSLNITLSYFLPPLLQGGFSHSALITGIPVTSCLCICWLFLKTPTSRHYLPIIFLFIFCTVSVLVNAIDLFTGEQKFDWFLWPMSFFTIAILVPVRWQLHAIAQIFSLTLYFGLAWIFKIDLFISDKPFFNVVTLLFWLCGICTFSVFLYERLRRSEFEARKQADMAYQELSLEKERSETLLLNILPEPIAQRLKADQQIIADDFDEVTVLFADIVNFTPLSASMSPTELVKLLNQIFSCFDRLAEKHGLEKIKTIGDAYMVVGGLPEPTSNHINAIAAMSLDMQDVLCQFNQEHQRNLNIRIGIHTGSAIAGVIGLKKFAYDLWGDTVNTASRMESHGLPGRIHVTDAVYQALKDRYLFEKRGKIVIKGKGEMNTYFLEKAIIRISTQK
ncbi:MAG: adenylate/guanylate cyclase domain-containing protein [Cyanobacteria bacterium P01_E01_bin.42]